MQVQIGLQVSARSCLQFLGHIACIFVTPHTHTQLHLCCFQAWFRSVYTSNRDSLISKLFSIPCHILVSFEWWKNLDKRCSGVPFSPCFFYFNNSFQGIHPQVGSSSSGPRYTGQMVYPRVHLTHQYSGTQSSQI